MYLPCTLYANNISTLFFDSDMKIKVRTVYSAIDYDIKMGSYRRKIILIECNDKCRYLNKLTCKGLCGRCFICRGPIVSYHLCTNSKATKANTHLFHGQMSGSGK